MVEFEVMNLSRSERLSPRVVWRDSVASTNAELATLIRDDPAAWAHLAVLATDNQTAGRGRLGRTWVAPPGTSLAASVVLDVVTGPRAVPAELLGWIPLVAGTAMTRALREFFDDPTRVTLKWPNDVLIDDLKVCGILTELTSQAVIVGSGVNLTMTADQLPTETSTSLALRGARTTAVDDVLAGYVTHLSSLVSLLMAAELGPGNGVRDAVEAVCSTLGREVRVELPNHDPQEGVALNLDQHGRLVIELSKIRQQLVVAAADVTHLRVIMTHDSSTRDGTHPDPG